MKRGGLAQVITVALALGIAAFCGCGGSRRADSGSEMRGEVRIAGSSTVYPLSAALAEEFSKLHRNVRVSVSSTGTGGGFSNFFIPGKTDLNNASRPIKDSELKKCKKNGVEPIQLQVAIDALSVVANPKADFADCMTMKELKKLWGPGDPPEKWGDVNPEWPDKKMELYGPASTSGTFDYFTETVMGEEDAHRSDYQATEHDNTIVRGVAGSKYALGYFGYAYYESNRKRLKAVKIDDGDGCVEPSMKTAQNGSYPLSRPLYVYVNKESLQRPEVKAFVEFLIRESASELVSQVGYVPITEEIRNENLRKIGVEPADSGN